MESKSETVSAVFSVGPDTLQVPMTLHKLNRDRLVARLHDALPGRGVVLLEGGKSETRADSDHEHLFRQESWFQWAFGVMEPDCYGAIDVPNNRSILFIPRLPEAYAIWLGTIYPPSYFAKRYGVDEVFYVDEIDKYFSEFQPDVIYTLHGLNSDSGNYSKPATFSGIEKYRVDNGALHPHITECRVIKTDSEINVIRYACKVSSEAHKAVMKAIKPGMTEYQLESLFLHHAYYHGGCRNASYTCICATGPNSATLHYGHAGAPNDRVFRDGEIALLDMGAEYHCYGSDITCTFPANGKFTEDQKAIYNSVLAAQRAVESTMKPGVSWPDMHRLAERVLCEELKRYGLLQGNIEEMLTDEVNIPALFMPHGLGHFLGLDTHDCGGYPKGAERAKRAGLKSLRNVRPLQKGMVLTVEPGCYFIDALLKPALADPVKSKYLVADRIAQFTNFGGVRIEDDVVVTEDGIENLTLVPRTVEEIEAFMSK